MTLMARSILSRGFTVLLLCDLVLILATAASDLKLPYHNRFPIDALDLKREANVGVWFSSLQLAMVSMLAFLAGVRSERRASIYFWIWMALGLGFLGLSADETAQLHERVGQRFTAGVDAMPESAGATGWVPALAPLIIGFAATLVIAVRRWTAPEQRSARRMMYVGVACWVGVVLAEIFESYQRVTGMTRGLQGVVEEGLEVIGATLFVVGLTRFHTRYSEDRNSDRSAVLSRSG